jgi:hypothetical protein
MKRTPVHNALDVWPQLPIVLKDWRSTSRLQGTKNLLAAFQQHDRVCEIVIWHITNSLLKNVASIKDPFPALRFLGLCAAYKNAPVLPDSFLGGFAPRLRELTLIGIPFPTLPKLLLSTSDLVCLSLRDIPHSGYISPQAMVTSLSALTRLQQLTLTFRSPRFRTDRETRHLPPLTRIVLPALIWIRFTGESEYLEDLVAQIDTPPLKEFSVTFFNQLVFDTPLLRHFVDRTEIFKTFLCAHINFHNDLVLIRRSRAVGTAGHKNTFKFEIICKPSDWQLSSLSQICGSNIPPLSTLQHLEIHETRERWEEDVERTQWLDLLHLFPYVKHLVLNDRLAGLVAPALQGLTGERVTGMLPALQYISLKGSKPSELTRKAIAQFVAARQLSGHHITVEHGMWNVVTDEIYFPSYACPECCQ